MRREGRESERERKERIRERVNESCSKYNVSVTIYGELWGGKYDGEEGVN